MSDGVTPLSMHPEISMISILSTKVETTFLTFLYQVFLNIQNLFH